MRWIIFVLFLALGKSIGRSFIPKGNQKVDLQQETVQNYGWTKSFSAPGCMTGNDYIGVNYVLLNACIESFVSHSSMKYTCGIDGTLSLNTFSDENCKSSSPAVKIYPSTCQEHSKFDFSQTGCNPNAFVGPYSDIPIGWIVTTSYRDSSHSGTQIVETHGTVSDRCVKKSSTESFMNEFPYTYIWVSSDSCEGVPTTSYEFPAAHSSPSGSKPQVVAEIMSITLTSENDENDDSFVQIGGPGAFAGIVLGLFFFLILVGLCIYWNFDRCCGHENTAPPVRNPDLRSPFVDTKPTSNPMGYDNYAAKDSFFGAPTRGTDASNDRL